MIKHTNTIKNKIAKHNAHAHQHNFHTTAITLDVKNYYMAIVTQSLIKKVEYTFKLYRAKHKTNIISISKIKDKNLPPIAGPTNHPAYLSTNLNTIFDIILFALNNAYFTLGIHILRQILGLPMG
jgi:hypothetical protein